MNKELDFFSTKIADNIRINHDEQTGGNKINSENIDIIKAYRKKIENYIKEYKN